MKIKMQTLETKTKSDMCINHYRSMVHIAVTDEEIRHRNCNGYNESCPEYNPCRNYHVTLNFGKPVMVFR